ETSKEKLKEYFGNYGDISQTLIMRDKISGRPRGFGFVVFSDPSVLDNVLQQKHTIDGRTVEAKRALSREEQHVSKAGNGGGGRSLGGSTRTKKIFVGGLPPTLSEEGFRHYFETYGQVTDVVVMYDQQTNRPRGFGFISFDSEDAVDRVLHKTFHDLNGKQVEVKRALPKNANPSGGSGGRSMGGGGYQGYGSSGGNSGSYEGRMGDSNRYMQSQNAGGSGGFPSYGSSGYGNPGYGYGGPGSNGMGGYNGYGSYGGRNPRYGAPTGAPYGNPNAPIAGYGSAPSGGPQAAAPTSQSPSGAAGYRNQGYGYGGGYGGNDGSYGNPATGYGAVGGHISSAPNSNSGTGAGGDMQSGSGGYLGSGYGDANGNSGYGNAGWRADPSQAAGNYGAQGNGRQGGYGGYGGAPARQG
nr:heterogeneous nuclear ribonucleoprotein 1 [Tanacetum cinerariifolium]